MHKLLQERAMKGVLRVPEVLRVSPGVLEAKVDYYTGGLCSLRWNGMAGCSASCWHKVGLCEERPRQPCILAHWRVR